MIPIKNSYFLHWDHFGVTSRLLEQSFVVMTVFVKSQMKLDDNLHVHKINNIHANSNVPFRNHDLIWCILTTTEKVPPTFTIYSISKQGVHQLIAAKLDKCKITVVDNGFGKCLLSNISVIWSDQSTLNKLCKSPSLWFLGTLSYQLSDEPGPMQQTSKQPVKWWQWRSFFLILK